MTNIYFKVNKEKIRETIIYIAGRLDNPTVHTIFKIMYFADKMHLGDYGRFITGDKYIAMEYGPVPSLARDITQEAKEFSLSNGIEIRGYHVIALRDADIGILSESDTECLDKALELHGHKSFGQLTDESHDSAWHSAPENGEISVESIVMLLDNSIELLAHLQDQHP